MYIGIIIIVIIFACIFLSFHEFKQNIPHLLSEQYLVELLPSHTHHPNAGLSAPSTARPAIITADLTTAVLSCSCYCSLFDLFDDDDVVVVAAVFVVVVVVAVLLLPVLLLFSFSFFSSFSLCP